MGAGKSTLSQQLAQENNAVLISEDEWLASLYPDQIHTFDDYREYSAKLKPLLAEHINRLLLTGTNVVMDFPANTRGQRKWLRELGTAAGIVGNLVYLRASDETCLARLAIRREQQPSRAKFDTESVFNEVTAYFQEPDEDEGFRLELIDANIEK